MKVDKFKDQEHWKDWIGKEVIKHSNKPFKSGKQVEVVTELISNARSGRLAFMLEGGSAVDCHQVKLNTI